MKVVFQQDYKWYPNGYKLQSFGVLQKHDLDDKIATRLIKAGIAELDEPKKEAVKEVIKEEPKEAPKKRGRKPKTQDKRVKKENVEEK